MSLSKIEYKDGIYLKRNDLNNYLGCYGGKAECIYNIISSSKIKRFVTCGAKESLQCDIVSSMCETLGYECHVFTSGGKDTKITDAIQERKNCKLHKIEKGGYINTVKSRALRFSQENNMCLIPFGCECVEAVNTIAMQISNIPDVIKRIVVPVGGGITMCGIMHGLVKYNKNSEVVGIITGKDPAKTIKTYQPIFNSIKYKLIPYKDGSAQKLYKEKTNYSVGGVKLDPIYEGKCYPFLQKGDLLWIVGYHEV